MSTVAKNKQQKTFFNWSGVLFIHRECSHGWEVAIVTCAY